MHTHNRSLKYVMQDLSSQPLTAQAAQLAQSSHGALNSPYALIGLGPVSYYIENFYFGMPLATTSGSGKVEEGVAEGVMLSRHYLNMMGCIPNSQLVASPTDLSDPSYWWLQVLHHLAPLSVLSLSPHLFLLCLSV